MSDNIANTSLPQLEEPIVIALYPPVDGPGSAIERRVWDIFNKGLIERSSQLPEDYDDDVDDVDSADKGASTSYRLESAFGLGQETKPLPPASTMNKLTSSQRDEDTVYESDLETDGTRDGEDIDDIAIRVGYLTQTMPSHDRCISISGDAAPYGRGSQDNAHSDIRTPAPSIPPHISKLYTMRVNVEQAVPPGEYQELLGARLATPLRLFVDTGMDATWILGLGYRQLTVSTTSPFDAKRDVITDDPNTNQRRPYQEHNTLFNHDLSPMFPTKNRPETLHARLQYMDKGAAALLTYQDKPELVEVEYCYDWRRKNWRGKLEFNHRFAVAHAVVSMLHYTNTEGGVGFGPNNSMRLFNSHDPQQLVNFGTAPSFLQASSAKTPPPSKEGGTIIFFAIRPYAQVRSTDPRYHLLYIPPSWMSFNAWPSSVSKLDDTNEGREPMWSTKIPLAPGGCGYWDVRLLSMTFQQYDLETQRYVDMKDGTITFDEGLIVTLDTGASTSWVPAMLVRRIRTKIFGDEKNLAMDREKGDTPDRLKDNTLNYVVSDRVSDKCVMYTFSGVQNHPVKVLGPVDHFICTKNLGEPLASDGSKCVREGLLCVASEEMFGGPSRAIFGLNFFHTMYVALHTPHEPDGPTPNMPPYVRMAPQWAHEITKFELPLLIED